MKVESPAEQLLFTTVRLAAWNSEGSSVGTGFVYGFEENGKGYFFLVTNRHVVDGYDEGEFSFTRRKGDESPDVGRSSNVTVSDLTSYWCFHPDSQIDIAVAPLVPVLEQLTAAGLPPFYRAVSPDYIPSEDTITELDAIEECIFIGYPNGIWDPVNNLPVVRRGTTASPIKVDFGGEPRFLLDASVFPGSSGSPVFLFDWGSYTTRDGSLIAGSRLHFLGVLSEVYFRENRGEIAVNPIPTNQDLVAVTKEMLDLGVVLKARLVRDAVRWCLNHHGKAAAELNS